MFIIFTVNLILHGLKKNCISQYFLNIKSLIQKKKILLFHEFFENLCVILNIKLHYWAHHSQYSAHHSNFLYAVTKIMQKELFKKSKGPSRNGNLKYFQNFEIVELKQCCQITLSVCLSVMIFIYNMILIIIYFQIKIFVINRKFIPPNKADCNLNVNLT